MTRPSTFALISLIALSTATATFSQDTDGAVSNAIDDVASAPVSLADIANSDPSLSIHNDGAGDTMVMLSDLLFDFGDATLQPDAIAVLQSIAPQFAGAPGLEISGHTDAVGDEETNAALGLRRAEAVRTWFIENSDLDADSITAITFGEIAPIADNEYAGGGDNPEGRALNRRVEFTLPDPQAFDVASSQ